MTQVTVLPKDPNHEFVKVMAHATVEKRTDAYDERFAALVREGHKLEAAEAIAKAEIAPYEVVEGDYNALVDVGIILLLDAMIGTAVTAYNNTNARLGVGDSAAAWGTTQIDLQAAANKLRKAMNATYPLGTGTKTITFRSDYTTGEANWVWNEWAIFNSGTANVGMLNRKVENLGTKASGTWTLTVTFTLT